MSKKAVVAYADLNQYERTIVTSDIHGDHEGFLRMLRQVDFSSQDALVIVGDIDEASYQYMNACENLTLREMAQELGMGWQTLDEVRALKKAIFFALSNHMYIF